MYSIYAVWGLALAYRRIDNDGGRACKSAFIKKTYFSHVNIMNVDELENATKKVL